MAETIKAWTSRISSCEFATITLRDDGVELELLDDRGTHRNLISFEEVANGEIDSTVKNDFGEAVLQELRQLLAAR